MQLLFFCGVKYLLINERCIKFLLPLPTGRIPTCVCVLQVLLVLSGYETFIELFITSSHLLNFLLFFSHGSCYSFMRSDFISEKYKCKASFYFFIYIMVYCMCACRHACVVCMRACMRMR